MPSPTSTRTSFKSSNGKTQIKSVLLTFGLIRRKFKPVAPSQLAKAGSTSSIATTIATTLTIHMTRTRTTACLMIMNIMMTTTTMTTIGNRRPRKTGMRTAARTQTAQMLSIATVTLVSPTMMCIQATAIPFITRPILTSWDAALAWPEEPP